MEGPRRRTLPHRLERLPREGTQGGGRRHPAAHPKPCCRTPTSRTRPVPVQPAGRGRAWQRRMAAISGQRHPGADGQTHGHDTGGTRCLPEVRGIPAVGPAEPGQRRCRKGRSGRPRGLGCHGPVGRPRGKQTATASSCSSTGPNPLCARQGSTPTTGIRPRAWTTTAPTSTRCTPFTLSCTRTIPGWSGSAWPTRWGQPSSPALRTSLPSEQARPARTSSDQLDGNRPASSKLDHATLRPWPISAPRLQFYEETFLAMQKEIFSDIGSQHFAYQQGGMAEIQRMEAAGMVTRRNE